MNGIIILDGPDASGKTTLQEYFVKKHKAVPIHLTFPAPAPLNMWEYQTQEMKRAIDLSNENLVIVDRHWISENIYAKVFRSHSPWPHMGRMMHRVWLKHAALYIICVPNTVEEGVARHNANIDRAHPYGDTKFAELISRYRAFLFKDCVTGIDYAAEVSRDIKGITNPFYIPYRIEIEGQELPTFTQLVLDKVRALRAAQYQPALNTGDHNITGHFLRAKYLIIGDQSNPKNFHSHFQVFWPFYEYANSSLFLAKVCSSIGLREENVMWTNALNPEGTQSPHVLQLIQRGIIPIALGKRALTICNKQKLKVFSLPHPQYAQRFNVVNYPQMFEEIINGTRGL